MVQSNQKTKNPRSFENVIIGKRIMSVRYLNSEEKKRPVCTKTDQPSFLSLRTELISWQRGGGFQK